MRDGKFTAKERAYLMSLPAVAEVSAQRIRYTDQFRIECMVRYADGESPAAIFRGAGLDPRLIGYKRIERCIARWKKNSKGLPVGRRRGGAAVGGDDAAMRGLAKRVMAPVGAGVGSGVGDVGGADDGSGIGAGLADDGSDALVNAKDTPSPSEMLLAEGGRSLSEAAEAQLGADSRDMLIARQALRIDELERLVQKLLR